MNRQPLLITGTLLSVLLAAAFVVSAFNGVFLSLLYPPFVATTIATLIVWRSGRKRVKLGHCQCGYDLTGNVSGRCPECGTKA